MKVGILTFHRATNYGAILQAYALVSYLKDMGYDAKIIDYKPKGMGQLYASVCVPGIIRKCKRVVLNILILKTLRSRKRKRDMFWRYTEKCLPLTEPVTSEKDMSLMDAYIVGSDQIWSTCFTGGLDKFYWGQFNHKGAKMISYAGSAAEDMDGSFTSNNNAKLLDTFDYISVREEELQSHIQEALPNKDIVKVLDPTLMAGVSYFEELVKNEHPLLRPYVLIYQVIRTKDKLIQDYAKQIAEEKGLDIVEIKNSKLYITSKDRVTVSKDLINPTQYVGLFKYAEFVITTSFHGTAFSLLFNRPFNVISVSPEVDSRAKDILHQLSLDDRMITLPISKQTKDINWSRVNEELSVLRQPSREFLKKALS